MPEIMGYCTQKIEVPLWVGYNWLSCNNNLTRNHICCHYGFRFRFAAGITAIIGGLRLRGITYVGVYVPLEFVGRRYIYVYRYARAIIAVEEWRGNRLLARNCLVASDSCDNLCHSIRFGIFTPQLHSTPSQP